VPFCAISTIFVKVYNNNKKPTSRHHEVGSLITNFVMEVMATEVMKIKLKLEKHKIYA